MDLKASDIQGGQFGDHNVQNNVWNIVYDMDHRLDAASFGDLAPHHAADRIRAMGHEDAVVSLAAAEVAPAAKILNVLLKTDEALAVSLLADISRGKAEKLITTVTAASQDREWLRQLPEAAEAIGKRSEDLKWADPGRLERADYYRLASNSGRLLLGKRRTKVSVPGYCRVYKDGRIYWSEEGGPHAITGAILEHYISSGECGGEFGVPIGDAIPIPSTFGPLWVQRFRSGAIYSQGPSVTPVTQGVVNYLDACGGADQFYPLGAATTATSLHGTRGWVQRFCGSRNLLNETVYDTGRAFGVGGEIESFYDRLGGTSSWLGYPMSNATNIGSNSTQDFEGGTVFTGIPVARVVAVPAASMNLIRDEGIRGRLGFPVAAEQPSGNGGDRLQFFENGVVTLRDGKREVWVRPHTLK